MTATKDYVITYDLACEEGEWLEDAKRCKVPQFSRYLIDEESVWVCHACCTVIDDPSEHECEED